MREGPLPARWRMRLVRAFYLCKKSVRQAANMLRRQWRGTAGEGVVTRPNLPKLIRRWVDAFETRYSLQDAPRPGRPCSVPEEQVMECSRRFKAGVIVDGEVHHYFSSWAEAVETDGYFAAVADMYGIEPETLWRHMRDADRDLTRLKEESKWPFSDFEKYMRVEYASVNLAFSQSRPAYLDTLVFLDEASLYVNRTTGRTVWVSKSAEHPMLLTGDWRHSKRSKLKWYFAVNALLGLVGVFFTTGTTGHPHMFMVRGALQTVAASRQPCSALNTF